MKTIPKTWVYCTLFVINIFLVSCSSSVKEERAQYDTSEIEQPAPTEEMAAEEPELNTESYAYIQENGFKNTSNNPLSTFSIDVDNASYTNTRRFLKQNGMLPPPDAVRIEEFINYFDYSYPIPSAEETFSIQHELGECMWNKSNYLLKLGIKGYTIPTEDLPPSNLTFLIDVSGSMEDENKLPLLKNALRLLVNKLEHKDKVALVVYAGGTGVVLNSTPASEKETIINALDNLTAGGSTAGFDGLKEAYAIATQNFIEGGNNRIFLATDGDFNVGPSSDGEMARLVEENRAKGIQITVLGFGMGNYKDSKMEIIADKGDGNYFYIDDITEAQHVLVDNLAATMFTIAKDVKIQIEFNPVYVESYRLIGYENRLLNDEDFTDDKKDAGELGAGHTVTALYEIVPAKGASNGIPLKYQTKTLKTNETNELATVKIRFKKPNATQSIERNVTVTNSVKEYNTCTSDFRFVTSVAAWGMLLRNSNYAGDLTYEKVLTNASLALTDDRYGYKAEFLDLVRKSRSLTSTKQ